MHLTCTQEDLSRSLDLLNPIFSGHNIIPILENVRITADENNIELQANNLEVGVKTMLQGNVIDKGITTIPGRVLCQIARDLPAEEVALQGSTDHHIDVVYSSGAYKLFGLSADKFPEVKTVATKLLEVEGETLCKMLDCTRQFTSKQADRPELTGVYFDLLSTPQCFVGTDSRRIAISYNKDLVEMAGDSLAGFIVSERTCNAVVSAFSLSELVSISIKDQDIIFSDNDTVVSGRLIRAKFPNYKKLLPDKSEILAVVFNTKEVKDTLRRISPLLDDELFRVTFDIMDTHTTISCSDGEGGSAVENISSFREQDNRGLTFMEMFTIALNSKHLTQALRPIRGSRFRMYLTAPESMVLIENEGTESYRHLLAPMLPEQRGS